MSDKTSKFVLYGFDGKPRRFYCVTESKLDLGGVKKGQAKPGHTVIIVDRSGSMWGDIGSIKDMLIKLLTLDEYNNSSMLISLISYSTSGDCTVHFRRVPVKDVMKAKSPQQAEIKRIQASGLTCISQAMKAARDLVEDGEPTAIVLHSDGYANDPGVWAEQRNITSICEALKGRNVFVNTVAYRDSSDFAFLSAVANAASGKCVKADSVKDVYDALHEAAAAVNGEVTPPIEVEKGASDYLVFVSESKRRINGGDCDLMVAGMSPDDDGTVYRYCQSSKEDYDKAPYPVNQHGSYVLALARAKLSEGRLNDAKFAAYSSCNPFMLPHLKALTGPQLAAFAKDIEVELFKLSCSSVGVGSPADLPAKPQSLGGSVTVVGVLTAMEAARDGIMLNLKKLQEGYKLRGVKRIPGVRTAAGIEKPWLDVEFTDAGDWVPMGTFDFNRNSATVNMLVVRPSRLVKVADRKPISDVAGISVASLPSFRNYTIVGDGEVVTKEITVKFGKKDAFDLMNKLGVLGQGATFSPSTEYVINLSELSVASFDFSGDVSDMREAFRQIVTDKVVSGILAAVTKGTSSELTPEQIAELKKHYLSASLYLNLPTTTEYDDLEAAVKDGRVDTRVSYKVEIGDVGIINPGQLYSANEFLARHFMIAGGKSTDKPKMPMFLDPKVSFQAKPPSPKMKLGEVDAVCKPIFAEFLGLETNGKFKEVLKRAGVDKSPMDLVRGGLKAMEEAKAAVEDHMEKVFRSKVMPFAFFVGATGLLPDAFSDVKGLSADELEAQIPGLKLGKDERDGTFFRIGEAVVSVYAKNEYFSTGKSS